MFTSKKGALQRLFLRPVIEQYVAMSPAWRCDESQWMGDISQRTRKAARLCLCCFFLLSTGQAAIAETACPLSHAHKTAYDETATVRYVHDGDTLHLQDGRKVRLIGINTAEVAHGTSAAEAFSNEAKNILKAFFDKDKTISLVYGEDKQDHYKRVLAHAFSKDGTNIQAALLNQGYAHAITFPPNTRFSACYLEQERKARCSKTGLWKQTNPVKAKNINDTHIGFKLVKGKVTSINTNKKGIWLSLDDVLTVGIRPDNQPLFDIDKLHRMLNQSIVVRGWLSKSKSKKYNPYYIRVRHPLSIQLADAFTCN